MVFVDRGMNTEVTPQTRSWKQLHQFAGKMMLLSYLLREKRRNSGNSSSVTCKPLCVVGAQVLECSTFLPLGPPFELAATGKWYNTAARWEFTALLKWMLLRNELNMRCVLPLLGTSLFLLPHTT